MSPFFTIITATYNAASVLQPLLASLAAQTCRDFVWLVQDGGSTDATVEVIEHWRARLPALSLESAPDAGIYDAWNTALDRAGNSLGQWVLFLGADDALASPEALERAHCALTAMPTQIVLAPGGAQIVGQGTAETIEGSAEAACARLRWDMPFCHTALFHRARLFATLRFDARYRVLGDYDFVCRAIQQDSQVQAVPLMITRMRRGGISGSLCMQPAIFRESCHIALRHFKRLQWHHLNVGVKVAVVAVLCRVGGSRKAEHVMDALRRLRGKSPVWYTPPHCTEHLRAARCAIVLVHYNNPEDTLACLAALRYLSAQPAHIVVVDNGSDPHALARVRAGWQALLGEERLGAYAVGDAATEPVALPLARCLLLPVGANVGFSGGNNAALRVLLRHTACAAFWLLNNDTVPHADALDALCARLNARPDAGLCGSTLLFAHSPDTVQAAGGCRYSPWTGRTSFLRGGESAAALAALSPAEVAAVERRTGYIVGASCCIRREVLECVTLLPEAYFLYYEDVAFALEVRRAGYALAWARDSIVLHKEGASTHASKNSDDVEGTAGQASTRISARPASVDYLSIRNRMAVVRRYSPWALPVALASLVGVAAHRVRRGQAHRLGLIARAAWHGLVGRMGPPRATKS